jgi:hypothetical protein
MYFINAQTVSESDFQQPRCDFPVEAICYMDKKTDPSLNSGIKKWKKNYNRTVILLGLPSYMGIDI